MKNILITSLVAVVLVVTMWFLALTPEPVYCERPDVHLTPLAGYTCVTGEISEAELTILPGDTEIEKLIYTAPNGRWFAVSLVVGGRSKSSIHRPELCLPSQGFRMTEPRTIEVDGIDWRFITLDGGYGRPSFGFTYTFFNQAGFHTSDHIRRILRDVWDRSILNRIDRWAMVTVYTSETNEYRIAEFLSKLWTKF